MPGRADRVENDFHAELAFRAAIANLDDVRLANIVMLGDEDGIALFNLRPARSVKQFLGRVFHRGDALRPVVFLRRDLAGGEAAAQSDHGG